MTSLSQTNTLISQVDAFLHFRAKRHATIPNETIGLTKQMQLLTSQLTTLTMQVNATRTQLDKAKRREAAAAAVRNYEQAESCQREITQHEVNLAQMSAAHAAKFRQVDAKAAELSAKQVELNLEEKKDMDSREALRLFTLVEQALPRLKNEEEVFVTNKKYKLAGATKKQADALIERHNALRILLSSCSKNALRVKAGLNSLKNALKIAKENGINEIFLENGVHDEFGEYVVIDFPVTIIGESKEACTIIGGLDMKGKKQNDVNVKNLKISQSKGEAVRGDKGMSFHLFNLDIDLSKGNGVWVRGSKRNTMKNCRVCRSRLSGLYVYDGLMTLQGSDTFFHNNVTFADTVGTARGGVHYYGLHTSSSSTLRLVLPLTIGNISRKNGGGGNFGGKGRIVSYNKDTCEGRQH